MNIRKRILAALTGKLGWYGVKELHSLRDSVCHVVADCLRVWAREDGDVRLRDLADEADPPSLQVLATEFDGWQLEELPLVRAEICTIVATWLREGASQ